MAKTAFATGNALTKKLWDEKLFRDIVKMSYWSKFEAENSSALVHVKTNLEKSKGDKETFGLRMRLTGSGITSGQTMENNEEKLVTYTDDVTLEQYRHAVRDEGEMDRKRAVFDISVEAEQAIKDWGAEKIDQLKFDAMFAAATKVMYLDSSGDPKSTTSFALAKAQLNATNSKLTPELISAIKTNAMTGGARSYVPLRPIKVDGGEYFVLLVHPDAMFDLKRSTEFAQALREAEVRGPKNPLFKNATAVWDNVVIHEHENVTIGTDGGGSTVPFSYGAFMGAQALIWAWGKRPQIVKETFDYGDEEGYCWKMIGGVTKPQFNSVDFGSVGVAVARTNIAGL